MRSGLASRTVLHYAAGCLLALFLAAGCRTAAAQTPAGTARIWFYRVFEPSVSLNLAPVALNGALVGYVQPDGSPLYRDVPAGRYHITVESTGMDGNQDRTVDLAPGQEVFVKILALSAWEDSGDKSNYHRDTFYVSLVPPQVARAEIASHPL